MKPIETRDILVIINPNSGKKQTIKILTQFNSLYPNITTIVTHSLMELEKVFQLNIEKYRAFIVVGGDGTVNSTIKYLQHRNDKLLGVLPTGSGNGFARELGFKHSIENLINDTLKGESINIDLLSVNGDNCVNVAGLGFDSFVAHNFQNRSGRGLKNYILASLQSFFKFKPFEATITYDQKTIHDKFWMITFANTRQFGNNAVIAPCAKPNDGLIELILIKPFPLYMYPIFMVKLFWGGLKNSKYVKFISVKGSIEIISDFTKYHIDGDPKSFDNVLSVKMPNEKIRIVKTKYCSLK